MSKLFLWKIGSLEHKILPNKQALDSLKYHVNLLTEDLKTGHAHLIWGPELSCEVFDVDDDAKHVVVSVDEIDGSDKVKINIDLVDE